MVSTAFPSPALPPQRRSREAGLGMGSSPQPHIPASPRCLAPTASGTWRWRQEKGPQLTFLSYKYISISVLSLFHSAWLREGGTCPREQSWRKGLLQGLLAAQEEAV